MSECLRNGSTCLIMLLLAPVVFADTTPPADETAAPLSVAPLDVIEYPEDRPEWVSKGVEFDKDSFSFVVVSGPCETPEESMEELRVMQRAAVLTYVSEVSDSGGQDDFYPISDEEIDVDFVMRRYSGTVIQGDMKMYEDAVEIQFSPDQRDEIQAAWKNYEVRDRLGVLGFIVVIGFVMLVSSSALVGMVSQRVERREKAESAA